MPVSIDFSQWGAYGVILTLLVVYIIALTRDRNFYRQELFKSWEATRNALALGTAVAGRSDPESINGK